jgi:hypothetical protein
MTTSSCFKCGKRLSWGNLCNDCKTRRARRDAPLISYDHVHRELKKLWGKASQYQCITCGRAAGSWSYDGTDPDELTGYHNTGPQYDGQLPMRFSQHPEFYAPKCYPCHKITDLNGLSRPSKALERSQNRLGQDFGYLTVIAGPSTTTHAGHTRTFWLCVCKCGNQTKVRADRLLSGKTRSCSNRCFWSLA